MTAEVTLVVRTGDPTPPYEQLRRQLADGIRSGLLEPGSRLPPLRQLAADLGLAVGTVARTYRELEEAGLVRSRRGAGTRVADTVPDAGPQRELFVHAATFIRTARLLGAGAPEIRAALDHVLGDRHGLPDG